MKIAVVYNRESKNVINLFGIPNHEKYGKNAIKRISDALKKGGHQVATFEGDKLLITRLEEFMPRVVSGEQPGMVFNVSYGIQGQARYTHVPSILEMVGIPYIGSGPLAHSLALDKVVAKMIFKQNGLPTPDFFVLETPDFKMPELQFPMIVKPKNEAVSFGLKIVYDEKDLRESAQIIFDKFKQPVLVETYIDGREINVGLLGNNPPETFPPVEIVFSQEGPPIYTYEDKIHKSGRTIVPQCPADISDELRQKAQSLALKAFSALGCYDFARVDMRMDSEDNIYILEINSLASLGTGGSYVAAAKNIGMDYKGLVNRMVEVASARYFGTPAPPELMPAKSMDKGTAAFKLLTQRRDTMEKRLETWSHIYSRTLDPVGIKLAVKHFSDVMDEMKMSSVEKYTDQRFSWMWRTKKGFEGGVLFILHIDIPLSADAPSQVFRRDPEFLYGEGIGASRAPIVMLEYILRTLKSQKLLHSQRIGVLLYADEGVDARYSEINIRNACRKAEEVIVLRPANPVGKFISQRRGIVKYRLLVEGNPLKLGEASKKPQPLLWLTSKLNEIASLSSRSRRIAVSAKNIKSESFPMLMPHRVSTDLLVNYYYKKDLDSVYSKIKKILNDNKYGLKWQLEEEVNRPPMKENRINKKFADKICKVAEQWDIPLQPTSSLWPSVAGLVPEKTPVICGMGPIAEHLHTPDESIQRMSLIQQTLLLIQYLIHNNEG